MSIMQSSAIMPAIQQDVGCHMPLADYLASALEKLEMHYHKMGGAFPPPIRAKIGSGVLFRYPHLEGLELRTEAADLAKESSSQQASTSETHIRQTKKVFVVHGHDIEAKETVARFIERLRLDPIILHEQANAGRTINEKFEVFSDVGFAVVLLTPDDIGASSTAPQQLKPRARQNVILELGYFMGKLSRFRVCALYKPGVEIPSDYQGVLYIELDSAGAWRTKLAQELVEANYSIDLEGLLHA